MTTTKTLMQCATALILVGVASATVASATKAGAQTSDPRANDRADQLLNTAPAPAAKPNSEPASPIINDGEAYHRADDSRQTPEELRTTQALNDEITSRNQLAENQERAEQAAYEGKRALHEEAVAKSTAAQLAYEEELRRSESARRQFEIDRARWEADVRACEAGDRTRCAAPR